MDFKAPRSFEIHWVKQYLVNFIALVGIANTTVYKTSQFPQVSGAWQTVLTFNTASKLTHWGRDKMAAISQTTFSNAFSWMKMFELSLIFHWRLLTRVQLTIYQHWFGLWLGAEKATSHYLNQRCLSLLTHICVTRPQWVKPLLKIGHRCIITYQSAMWM